MLPKEILKKVRQIEIRKEGVRHYRIVVLPRMNDQGIKLCRTPSHLSVNWSHLHEVRASAGDENDL